MTATFRDFLHDQYKSSTRNKVAKRREMKKKVSKASTRKTKNSGSTTSTTGKSKSKFVVAPAGLEIAPRVLAVVPPRDSTAESTSFSSSQEQRSVLPNETESPATRSTEQLASTTILPNKKVHDVDDESSNVLMPPPLPELTTYTSTSSLSCLLGTFASNQMTMARDGDEDDDISSLLSGYSPSVQLDMTNMMDDDSIDGGLREREDSENATSGVIGMMIGHKNESFHNDHGYHDDDDDYSINTIGTMQDLQSFVDDHSDNDHNNRNSIRNGQHIAGPSTATINDISAAIAERKRRIDSLCVEFLKNTATAITTTTTTAPPSNHGHGGNNDNCFTILGNDMNKNMKRRESLLWFDLNDVALEDPFLAPGDPMMFGR